MQGTADTFVCVECEQVLPTDMLAFDTNPEHRLGVCNECDQALQTASALPAWMSREVA